MARGEPGAGDAQAHAQAPRCGRYFMCVKLHILALEHPHTGGDYDALKRYKVAHSGTYRWSSIYRVYRMFQTFTHLSSMFSLVNFLGLLHL